MNWLAQPNPAAAGAPMTSPAAWWLVGIAVVALVAWWLWSPGRRELRLGGRARDGGKDGGARQD